MKKFLALVLSVLMVLSLVACGGEKTTDTDTTPDTTTTEPVDVVLATGGTSGTYYAVGGVLQTVLGDKLTLCNLTVESTGASKANVNMMTDGEAQMAILQSDVLNYAHEGTFTFAETGAETSALWVMGIYNETVQILAKPGINTVSDLKGKTVCVGDVGSGTEVNAWQVLGAVGLTKDDVNAVNGSFQDGVDQLKDGKIDAAFTVAGAPTTAIVDYATTNELNLVSLSADELAKVTAEYPFLVEDNLAAGTYTGQDAEVCCVAVQAALVADETVSEDVVYELVKAIYDNQADLTAGHAKWGLLSLETALDNTAPMHPGAEKYYKEVGAL
ncbi:MAG: TAXI family TRAP transporter solute-binding subunit [Eubacteriales bacterium]|nr:TAXI family TRAP transporter solute-binding subunit [Eubacteriales bacterium]